MNLKRFQSSPAGRVVKAGSGVAAYRAFVPHPLVAWDLLPQPLLYLSPYFEANRRDYYDLLLGVSERGAWREWVLFFLNGFAEQAQDTGARLKELQDLQARWRAQLRQAHQGGLAREVIDLVIEQPILSMPTVRDRFHVSAPTARQALNRLADLGVLQAGPGPGRAWQYVAQQVLALLERKGKPAFSTRG